MAQAGMGPVWVVWRAAQPDLAGAARLLDAFNREYDEGTPGPEALTARLAEVTAQGETVVLLGGRSDRDPVAVAVLRFRPALWSAGLECYLAELYVAPAERGHGLGRSVLAAAVRVAREWGSDTIDLGTSESDVSARALYESVGFVNRERPDGPITYFYELDLAASGDGNHSEPGRPATTGQ